MKFTDGFWLVRDGYSMRHATHVQRAELLNENGAISALIAPRVVENRGATLNIGTLDLRLDSPLDDVVRVRVAHHRGGKPALTYAITEHSPKVTLEESEGSVSLTTGRVRARLSTSTSWKLSFEAEGKVFAEQGAKGLSIVDAPEGKRYLSSQISLKVGENVYGLGERFTSFIKNGQTVDIWNADGGTSSEQAYKNIPF